MKKKRFVSTIALAAVMTIMAGCGKQEPVTTAAATATTAAPAVVEEAKPEEPSYDASAIIGKYLRGLRDRNILEGAKNIDLLAKSESMKHVVKNVTVDDSAVDMTKPGKYTARYIVTVDLDNLEKAEAYLAEHPEAMTPVKAEPGKDAADKAQTPAAKTEKTEATDDTAAAEVKDDAETASAAEDTAEPETGHTGETVETEAQAPDKDTEKKEDEAPAVAPADKEDPEGAPLPVIPDSVFEDDKTTAETEDTETPAEPAAEEHTEDAVPEENTAPAEDTGADKDTAEQTGTDANKTEEAEPADAVPAGTENGQASGDPAQSGNVVDVIIEKEVDVVTPDEAVKIIEDGGEVWTDNSQPATVEEIKNPEEKPAEEVKPEETKPAEETPKPEVKEDRDNDNTEDDRDPEPSHTSYSDDGEEDTPAPQHVHNWVTEEIYHEEKGHYVTETVQTGTRTVVDEEAWDEPIYEARLVCNVCGYVSDNTEEISDHMAFEHDFDGSWYNDPVQVGSKHHDAVTHEEPVYEEREHWVVDQEAWTETHTYCSGCGAEK